MGKNISANGNLKKARVTVLISDKTGFKMKAVIRDKSKHYIVIKRSFQQEDITFVSIYIPNIGAYKYIK